MQDVLTIVIWTVMAALVLAAVCFFVLKWIAVRIARRVAEATERAISASIQHGMGRAGVRIPGVRDPEQRARYLAQIDLTARVMDRLVPLPIVGGIGLDAILGLIPVVGDVISFGLSSVIIVRAAQLGVPEETLSKLVAIQTTDLVLGSIPVVGDLFDVAYRANTRSAALIRSILVPWQD